jgi:hypothetical protein
MEQYFTPILPANRRLNVHSTRHGYTEVELAKSTSVDEFMNYGWDFSDFWAFVAGDDEGEMWKIMWITEGTLIWPEKETLGLPPRIGMASGRDTNSGMAKELLKYYIIQRAQFTLKSGETYKLLLGKHISLPVGGSRIFWHAVTTSNCSELKLSYRCSRSGLLSGRKQLCQEFNNRHNR